MLNHPQFKVNIELDKDLIIVSKIPAKFFKVQSFNIELIPEELIKKSEK
jgi:RAB protein geranylgeranyltransferase component A